ncbi:MAG: hypothetical protein K5989_07125 [Lachnospiraceae bacterium]|nr:hypothetical protein [Lachnospiraceae bacterium]
MTLIPLASIILFGLILNHAIRKNNAAYRKVREEFWQKERAANASPLQSIDNLPYVRFPENLPLHVATENPRIGEYQETLLNLSKKKILNLTGLSNTDLKMKYGAKNLEELSKADQYFTVVCRTSLSLARSYLEEGFTEEAKALLHFGTEIGSDIKENWTILAELLLEEKDNEGLKELSEKTSSIPDENSRRHIQKLVEDYCLLDEIMN